MARSAAQAALTNPDILSIIFAEACEIVYSKERTLYRLVQVSKAFYQAGVPLLYRAIEISRSYPPDPVTSYAIRLRCLQENSSLGRYVRRLAAFSVTVDQLDKFLTYLPSLNSLYWEPLALQRGILNHLPRLPETLETLQLLTPSPEDAIYRYSPEALSLMMSPLRNLKNLVAQDLILPELRSALSVAGKQLETLTIDRTHKLKASAEEEECWPDIFDSVPALRVLAIFAMLPESTVRRLPASVERLLIQGLEPPALLEIVRSLEDPAWLPNLKSLPVLDGYDYRPEIAQLYGQSYFAALPSAAEVQLLAKEAIAAFRLRAEVQESGISKWDAAVFCEQVTKTFEEIETWQWQAQEDEEDEDETTDSDDEAWEE